MKIQISFLLAATAVLNLSAATNYVALDSPNPTPPYTNWATAAHVIQDAVDAARQGDRVLVTNGVYETGVGNLRITNELGWVSELGRTRVVVNKPLAIQSVNGPQVTVIKGAAAPGGGNGDGAVRCVYLGINAVLSGFTLTNGHTRTDGDWLNQRTGGGVWCESKGMVTNCTIIGNSALDGGGGVHGGTLRNCTITANSGDGVRGATLYNRTITGNAGVGAGLASKKRTVKSGGILG